MSDPTTLPFLVVDAFTNRPFAGNPAGVVVTDAALPEALMQDIALELHHSETAFVVPDAAGDNAYAIRYFTPLAEVELCGHATLGAAHALCTTGQADASRPLRFTTHAGDTLSVTRAGDGTLHMDFPADTPRPDSDADDTAAVVAALGVPVLTLVRGRHDYLAEVADVATLDAVSPDHAGLRNAGVRGVAVTTRGDTTDIASRFFAPGVGVDEDPVTGSVHCLLGPYWSAILGKDTLSAEQRSARGGTLTVHVRGDRVTLTGRAVTTARGELLLPG